MSLAYDNYIILHKQYVVLAHTWILDNIDIHELFKILNENPENPDTYYLFDKTIMLAHDESKYNPDEYDAYDNYFYNGGYSTEEGKLAFETAFLHHMHKNPHHWQYWVLIDDDKKTYKNGLKPIDIPNHYIMEMICDWWSFSWKEYFATEKADSLYEIFKWYDAHKDHIIFTESTRKKVEGLLETIRNRIDFVPIEKYISMMEDKA